MDNGGEWVGRQIAERAVGWMSTWMKARTDESRLESVSEISTLPCMMALAKCGTPEPVGVSHS
jgi:hypothetical protein